MATTIVLGLVTVPLQTAIAQDEPDAPVSVTARIVSLQGDVLGPAVSRLQLAEPAVLEITAVGPADAELFDPYRPETGPFQLLKQRKGLRRVEGGQQHETYRFDVLPTRLGVEKIPAVEIPYELADGTRGAVSTDLIRVTILGNLVNEQDPRPGSDPAPEPIITTNWALVWGLALGATLLLAALLTLLVLKALEKRFKALEPGPPPRPANEVALERLQKLQAASTEELPGPERMAETVNILRQYLGGRYQFDSLEMTSRELMAELDTGAHDLKDVSTSQIRSLLDDADLVKFARFSSDDEEARKRAPAVQAIVEATWEAIEPDPDEALIDTLEPATVGQRLYAGALDVALFGALGGLGFVALWWLDALAFGWAPLVVVGLGLFIRDALGSRSPGKRVLGLSVVGNQPEQPPATLRQRLTRNLGLLLWPLSLPVEALTLARHPLVVRLGDLGARTVVVQGDRS